MQSGAGAHLTIEQQEEVLSQRRATYDRKWYICMCVVQPDTNGLWYSELHDRWASMEIFTTVRDIAAKVKQTSDATNEDPTPMQTD